MRFKRGQVVAIPGRKTYFGKITSRRKHKDCCPSYRVGRMEYWEFQIRKLTRKEVSG